MRTIQNRLPDVYDYIIHRFADYRGDEQISELIYRIEHNLEEQPKCVICGNRITFNSGKKRYYYHFCSKACEHSPGGEELKKEIVKKTNLERYGSEYYNNREKYKQTLVEKYGVDHPLKIKSIEETVRLKRGETLLKKYGVTNSMLIPGVQEKMKTTVLERYGVENCMQNEEVKNKAKQTLIERYGVDSPIKNKNIQEKIKQTCIERYGVDNPQKNKEIKEKTKRTCIERYGVDNPQKNKAIKDKTKKTCIERYGVDNPMKDKDIMDKSFIERFKTAMGGTSKLENDVFDIIKETIDINTERQYSSQLYPYHCDYYLPKYDLYIELNGLWTHNDHLYDENNIKDKLELLEWQQKALTSDFYKTAIKTWTITDPEKYKTAKDNNLNILFIYSCDIPIIINKIKKYIHKLNNEQ